MCDRTARDLELTARILEATRAFNKASWDAASEALDVRATIITDRQLGRRDRPLLVVEVLRPLGTV